MKKSLPIKYKIVNSCTSFYMKKNSTYYIFIYINHFINQNLFV